MAETVAPAPAEVYAALPIVAPRTYAIKSELLRRLEADLPALIAYHNTQQGYAAGKGMEVPDGYHFKPAQLSAQYLNSIVIGHSVQRAPLSLGPTFKSVLTIEIYDVIGRIESKEQLQDSEDRIGLIATYLTVAYVRGCVNADDRLVWNQLLPHPDAAEREFSESEFYGRVLPLRITAGPACDAWS